MEIGGISEIRYECECQHSSQKEYTGTRINRILVKFNRLRNNFTNSRSASDKTTYWHICRNTPKKKTRGTRRLWNNTDRKTPECNVTHWAFNSNVTIKPILRYISAANVSTYYVNEIYVQRALEYLNIVIVVIATLVVVGNGIAVIVLMRCTRIPFQTKYISISLISSDALGAFVLVVYHDVYLV